MKHKLTQRIVRDFVRTLGGTFKANVGWGDFKLRFDNGENEYFANDLLDALETARAMKGGHERIEEAEHQLRVELGLIDENACVNCGHGSNWHVMNEDHMRFGECEHPDDKTGLCDCVGYVAVASVQVDSTREVSA